MKWVSVTSALALHEQQLAEHGGMTGIRDYGLLVSALSRPENIAAYEENAETDVARLAAAYCHGIVKNHPFADGNKRTAFAVLGLFLAKNGYDVVADDASCFESVVALADGRMTERDFGSWIKANLEFAKHAPKPHSGPKAAP